MAILKAEDPSPSATPWASNPSTRSALFLRTLIPRGAASRAISCSLAPAHALARAQSCPLSSVASSRQLVTTHANILTVHAVHDATLSLQPLTSAHVFTRVRDIAAVPSPARGRDVLVVLTEGNKVSFMQYDDHVAALRSAGDIQLLPNEAQGLADSSPRGQARLLATHPRRRLVAVAAVQSRISVFPVLFLPKSVSAGKIATVDVDGVILSLDFLEDDGDASGDAVLVALLQTAKEQVIALFTVGVCPDSGGGLSVTDVGSMITCVLHPNDVAVARATSKLTGESMQPPPSAVSVMGLPGCPYLFAVFVRGKVIAGDARSVVVHATSGEQGSVSVRVTDGISSRPRNAQDAGRFGVGGVEETMAGHSAAHSLSPQHISNMTQMHSAMRRRPGSQNQPLHSNIQVPHFASHSAGAFGAASSSSVPWRTLNSNPLVYPSVWNGSAAGSGVHPSATLANTMGSPTHSHELGETADSRHAVALRGWRPIHSRASETRSHPGFGRRPETTVQPAAVVKNSGGHRRGEEYLSYLFVPAYITLDVGELNGVATAWVDAGDHFRNENGDGGGLYFVMESGALFALRWSHNAEPGTSSFRIPSSPKTEAAAMRRFDVDFIGDVGPTACIASLDRKLIFISNDGADGSLRRLHVPAPAAPLGGYGRPAWMSSSSRVTRNLEQMRYGLEVRQEFLNNAPISDFIIAPPVKLSCKRRERNTPWCTANPDAPGRSTGRDSRGGEMQIYRESEEDRGQAQFPAQSSAQASQGRADNCRAMAYDEGEDIASLADAQSGGLKKGDMRGEDPGGDNVESAATHVEYGARDENELILCSGIGRHGTIRFVRPGAPVSLFASSESAFQACNDMWPIRFTKNPGVQAGIVMNFAESTRILYSVPELTPDSVGDPETLPPVAKLIDGTRATGIISSCRTITMGTLQDGVLAQVHENGIRLIYLKRADKPVCELDEAGGVLSQHLFRQVVDWTPPEDGFISVGTIGAGFILVCIVRKGSGDALLCLLELDPSKGSKNIVVAYSVALQNELSCAIIPEWETSQDDPDPVSPCLPPVAVLGTYAPSVEVRLLGPGLEVLDSKKSFPWTLRAPKKPPNPTSGNSTRGLSPCSSSSRGAKMSMTEEVDQFLTGSRPAMMTAVPESLCALHVAGRRIIFAGLRDGSVSSYSWGENIDGGMSSSSSNRHMLVESHRKLGHRPVVLRSATVAVGPIVLGQAERPWMCAPAGGGKMRWTPLAFPETTALCAYSTPGAKNCFAAVSGDGVLHICGLRIISEVSVRSIHLEATPRRVLAVDYPENSVVVATSSNCAGRRRDPELDWRGTGVDAPEKENAREADAALRVYDRRLGLQTGEVKLLPGEKVHVLLGWLGFVVVGTSFDIKTTQRPSAHDMCKHGRLLMYSIQEKKSNSSPLSQHPTRTKLTLCSEVVLPGAVLAGAAHPSESIMVVSCNEDVIVFGVPKSQTALVEVARATARALVVSLSICDDVICVGDRKDSIGFFTLSSNPGALVRDRSDHRKRIVSDAVMVDRTLSVGVDRTGALFSVGYEEGDAPKVSHTRWPNVSSVNRILALGDRLYRVNEDTEGTNAFRSGPGMSSEGLGEEFDLMQADSDSENAIESISQSPEFGDVPADDAVDTAQNSSDEADQPVANDSAQSQVGSGSGDMQNADASGGTNDAQDGGTDNGNQAQTIDGDPMPNGQANVPGITNAFANIMNNTAQGPDTTKNEGAPVPRNLECHHSFNLNDTSLRIRHGSFNRSEKVSESGGKIGSVVRSAAPDEQLFQRNRASVFCGTAGGSLIAAVPISASIYQILSYVEGELNAHSHIVGSTLGSSHQAFRSAYGAPAKGAVDGDLLDHFERLPRPVKLDITHRLGHPGESGVLYIEALIRDLFDRVA